MSFSKAVWLSNSKQPCSTKVFWRVNPCQAKMSFDSLAERCQLCIVHHLLNNWDHSYAPGIINQTMFASGLCIQLIGIANIPMSIMGERIKSTENAHLRVIISVQFVRPSIRTQHMITSTNSSRLFWGTPVPAWHCPRFQKVSSRHITLICQHLTYHTLERRYKRKTNGYLPRPLGTVR